MPSSRSRVSASTSRPSRMRSPALSCVTRSIRLSHSGVAYSGWLPTSRYRRAPLRRKTLLLRPQDTTRRNRYRATSSGESRRCPRKVQVTPYSFSTPNIRRSTRQGYVSSPHDNSIRGVLPRRPDIGSTGDRREHARERCQDLSVPPAYRPVVAALVRRVDAGGIGLVRPVSAPGDDLAGGFRRRRERHAGLGHAARQRPAARLVALGRGVLHHRASRVHAGGGGARTAP